MPSFLHITYCFIGNHSIFQSTVQEALDVEVDAYVLVYSCTDRESFKCASSTLYRLQEEEHSSKTIVLVANKVDLARKRQVTYEGKLVQQAYKSIYIAYHQLLCYEEEGPGVDLELIKFVYFRLSIKYLRIPKMQFDSLGVYL